MTNLMRQGQSFNSKVRSGGRRTSRVLAMDRTSRGLGTDFGFNRVLQANHFRPGADYVAGDGYSKMAWRGVIGGEANYALDDGSVSRRKLGSPIDIWIMYSGYDSTQGQNEDNFIPDDLFEDD